MAMSDHIQTTMGLEFQTVGWNRSLVFQHAIEILKKGRRRKDKGQRAVFCSSNERFFVFINFLGFWYNLSREGKKRIPN